MRRSVEVWGYTSVFVSGAIVLVIEIIGTRVLAPLFGTTIHVWTGLITTTLLSLASGYYIGGRLSKRKLDTLTYALLLVSGGISIIVLLTFRAKWLLLSDQMGIAYGPLIASLLLFMPSLTILGMIDPYVIALLQPKRSHDNALPGRILAIATIGGLCGALSTAYILIPRYSIKTTFISAATVLILMGVLGIILAENQSIYKRLINIRVVAIVVLIAFLGRAGTDLSAKAIKQSDQFREAKVLYQEQNLYSLNRVLAVPDVDGVRCFAADSALQTCIDPNNKDVLGYAGKMGLFINDLPTGSRVLLLGLGGGKLVKEWHRNDIMFDVVDINPSTFTATQDVLGIDYSENYSKHVDDARHFINHADSSFYDLIIIDIATTYSPPSHLYTKEFFESVSKVQKPSGLMLFLAHEPRPYIDETFHSLINTLRTVYPYSYISPDGAVAVIAGTSTDEQTRIDTVNETIRQMQNQYNAQKVFSTFSGLDMSRVDTTIPVITDERNNVEYLWRDKVKLYKQFSLLLERDFE